MKKLSIISFENCNELSSKVDKHIQNKLKTKKKSQTWNPSCLTLFLIDLTK